ncbi:MAG TPA: head GIN domain-containing protein, partial [Bacteroidales bacterium]|nr:head GIN domain-containing protein [Bacteroidales bacterium]
KIRVYRNFKVFFTQDSIKSVVITADSNLIDQIETRVENYELIIENHKKRHQQKNIHVYVSGPYLQEISALAGAGFETVNQLNVPSLILTGNAGSQMEVNVIADTLRVTLNAGSGIKLRGKGGMFVVKANAGSRVDAIEFEAAKAVVTANAGSSTEVKAGELNITATSGSTVNYAGNPVLTNINLSSGASIQKIE